MGILYKLTGKFGCLFTGILYFALISPGCKTMLNEGDEGCIDYEITYSDTMKTDMMASMLPGKMHVKFQPNYTMNELNIGMGFITASFITNYNEKTFTSLFQIWENKYALKYTPEETQQELNKLPKFTIEYFDETKVIAGHTCKKAVATEVGNEKNSFPIFYTTDIHIKDPNWNTPYTDIKGVMLEYQISHKDIVMQLKANKVVLEDIDDDTFIPSPDFKVVKKEELPEIIQNYF